MLRFTENSTIGFIQYSFIFLRLFKENPLIRKKYFPVAKQNSFYIRRQTHTGHVKLISNKLPSHRASKQKTKWWCCLRSTSLLSCLWGSTGNTLQLMCTGFCFPINTNPSQASSPNPCYIAAKQSPWTQCLDAEHNENHGRKSQH